MIRGCLSSGIPLTFDLIYFVHVVHGFFGTRKAFPLDVREEKILVVGCGNSLASETMCRGGFRDVLSIDISESVIAEMSQRSPRFHDAGIKCRCAVVGHVQYEVSHCIPFSPANFTFRPLTLFCNF